MTTYYVLVDTEQRRYPEDGETYVMVSAVKPFLRTAIEEDRLVHLHWPPEEFAILRLEAVLVKQGDTGVTDAGMEEVKP